MNRQQDEFVPILSEFGANLKSGRANATFLNEIIFLRAYCEGAYEATAYLFDSLPRLIIAIGELKNYNSH